MKKHLFNFIKGILAGISIAIGGLLYLICSNYIPYVGKIIGSILFSVGLFTVCTFKLNLYTGKIGQVFEEKKDRDFYIILVITYISNILASTCVGLICYYLFINTSLIKYVETLALSRTNFNSAEYIFNLIIKSLLCGLCVFLAVKLFNKDYLKSKGIIFLVFFVFLFVFSGYEHCIANVFYLVFGNQITNIYAYLNVLISTIFNSLGSFIGVKLFKFIKED